ncbi:MAG: alpha/beta hydrolase, partial [Thermoanaerobaculaceae bacterium]|nr:alpha/beta hydrolase [Thermoanaerobaculaceae bacterium]
MKESHASRVFVCVALVLLVAVAIAACGGSDTTASTSPSSAARAAASPSPSWSPTMSPAPIPVVKPGEKPPPFSELRALFAYDTSEPFGLQKHPDLDRTAAGATLRCITYQSGGNQAVGYLVMPEGEGPFPVVVYAPGWLYPVDQTWGEDAAAMAKKGYAGLLLAEPSTPFNTFDAPTDIASYIRYVTQERRALDLLATLPQIDSKRVGFVGWSNGAFLGSLLAGLEDRIKAYAFLGVCGTTTYSAEEKESLGAPMGAAFARWAARMSVIDNIVYVGRSEGAKLLFINGKGDANAMHDAKAFLAAAPKGT